MKGEEFLRVGGELRHRRQLLRFKMIDLKAQPGGKDKIPALAAELGKVDSELAELAARYRNGEATERNRG